MNTNHRTLGSLFAGIGGIDLGFERPCGSCDQCKAYAEKLLTTMG